MCVYEICFTNCARNTRLQAKFKQSASNKQRKLHNFARYTQKQPLKAEKVSHDSNEEKSRTGVSDNQDRAHSAQETQLQH